jgi:hypothetical protein
MCDTEWLTVVGIDTKASQADGSKTYPIIHTQILSDASIITCYYFKKSYWTPNEKQLLVIPLQWLLTHNKIYVTIIQVGLVIMKGPEGTAFIL